ncbi:N-succinylarginine dihydrolase [Parashewanella curva]|uniref:N-succinylarginine dihydrolase n=1 Tax=Parashewanella curva TaxID=2338552 RepID=A0A3L8Q062_9GAMM|nr:N-succinylarginine dihydrolase [Parashewanella curva]RLV61057.1 N-succinylarginine dihydrolase [Parashewanella curva]
MAIEMNFDGLVGPTHNYAGLSFGNVASLSNANQASNPKAAAKQGLQKAKALTELGLTQGILAPQERPFISQLKQLGFTGSEADILKQAYDYSPTLLAAYSSASCMWTANAATISPSADTADNKVHITPANLIEKLHRSIEFETTSRILKSTFVDENVFAHHDALPAHPFFGDEGAANHTRLCSEYDSKGVELFVYGREMTNPHRSFPKHFPARQTLEASQSIARLHQLTTDNTVFMQQNPDTIDQGVFHNDVISVGNRNVLFYHEQAFVDTERKFDEIRQKMGTEVHFIKVPTSEASIEDAVSSYLFNTQLVSLSDGMAIIAPKECEQTPAVKAYLDKLLTLDTPIKAVHYFDVKQSMQNGGGPACLRLRVALQQQELAGVNPNTILTNELYQSLDAWIEKHYRDSLTIKDLADPQLLVECRTALDELTQIMNLGSVYDFQR